MQTLSDGKVFCITQNSAVLTAMSVGYLLPLAVIIIFCSMIGYHMWTRKVPGEGGTNAQNAALRTSKRVTYMIIAVIVAFILVWFPLFISGLIANANRRLDIRMIFLPLFSSVFNLNGPLNMLIYDVFSENYRSVFRDWFRCVREICHQQINSVNSTNQRTTTEARLENVVVMASFKKY